MINFYLINILIFLFIFLALLTKIFTHIFWTLLKTKIIENNIWSLHVNKILLISGFKILIMFYRTFMIRYLVSACVFFSFSWIWEICIKIKILNLKLLLFLFFPPRLPYNLFFLWFQYILRFEIRIKKTLVDRKMIDCIVNLIFSFLSFIKFPFFIYTLVHLFN